MAGSLNRATLVGNVGSDPELKNLEGNKSVANFSLATSESWKDRNTGEKKERTEWHRIVVWNENLIEVIEKYVKKGSKVMVEGEIQTRKWQDQDGNDRYSTEIVLTGFSSRLLLLGDPRGGGDRDPNDNASRATGRSGGGSEGGRQDSGEREPSPGMDDDIPF
jgi:single-strand DNA-binding protein